MRAEHPTLTKTAPEMSTDHLHAHRTAKVMELIGTSRVSFEDAIQHAIADASATIRGLSGAQVRHLSVRIENGKIAEYKVDLKVAFGIERTPHL
ncbi:MAG: dodecin family protein [Methanobacteriota archaeon]